MSLMKFLALILLSMMMTLFFPGARGEETLIYSNLADEASVRLVQNALVAAGIDEEAAAAFSENVAYFNQVTGGRGLKAGFEKAPFPAYDQEGLQLLWEKDSPDFPGVNCRLTAFGLYKKHLSLSPLPAGDTTFLFMDRESLASNPHPLMTREEEADFFRLYAVVKTVDSSDPKKQEEMLLEAFRQRGLSFDESCRARLISVVLHSRFSEQENELFVGHTGVLVPEGEGLLFIEKLAFQLPYQATRFENRAELHAYLMRLYDASEGQPISPPLIMENGSLMAY